jgi:hypothetical protein
MPVDVRRSQDVALATFTGELTVADLFEVLERLLTLDREHGVLPRLIDSRTLRTTLTFSDMSQFTGVLRAKINGVPVRTAILVASDVEFGLARMFAALRYDPDVVAEVFRVEAEALAWLGVDAHHRRLRAP